jgi:hypothetical protein
LDLRLPHQIIHSGTGNGTEVPGGALAGNFTVRNGGFIPSKTGNPLGKLEKNAWYPLVN